MQPDWNLTDMCDSSKDPILGLAEVEIPEAFKERAQVTKTFPLVGGVAWGQGQCITSPTVIS